MVFFRSKEKLFNKYVNNLKNSDPEVRRRAAYQLSNLEIQEAVPHLINALSDNNPKVRWRAAYSLGDFGEQGYDNAFNAMVSHLENEQDWNVRRIIVMALRHWDERAIPPLIKALSDESDYVRRYAAMTLGFKGAEQAIPTLKKLASQDKSKEVRDYAMWALKQINSN